MFESVTRAAEEDAERAAALEKVMFVVPPAFSALCLVLYVVAAKLDARGFAGGVFILWILGMFGLTGTLSIQFLGAGSVRRAVLAWAVGIGTAWLTVIAGFFLLVAVVGMH